MSKTKEKEKIKQSNRHIPLVQCPKAYPLGVDVVLPLLLALLVRNVAQGDGNEHQYGNPHYDADQYNLIVDALVRVTCKMAKQAKKQIKDLGAGLTNYRQLFLSGGWRAKKEVGSVEYGFPAGVCQSTFWFVRAPCIFRRQKQNKSNTNTVSWTMTNALL